MEESWNRTKLTDSINRDIHRLSSYYQYNSSNYLLEFRAFDGLGVNQCIFI